MPTPTRCSPSARPARAPEPTRTCSYSAVPTPRRSTGDLAGAEVVTIPVTDDVLGVDEPRRVHRRARPRRARDGRRRRVVGGDAEHQGAHRRRGGRLVQHHRRDRHRAGDRRRPGRVPHRRLRRPGAAGDRRRRHPRRRQRRVAGDEPAGLGGVGRCVRRADQHRGAGQRALRRLAHRLRRRGGPRRHVAEPSDRASPARCTRARGTPAVARGIVARFIADAGGDYVYADDPSTRVADRSTSRPCSPTAPTPTCGSTPPPASPTRRRRVADDSRYGEFAAWDAGGVWSNAAPRRPRRQLHRAGSGAHRRLPARLHHRSSIPSSVPDRQLVFFSRLPAG